jgi:FdhD protein
MEQNGVESDKIIRRKPNGELEYRPDDLTIEEPLEIRLGRRAFVTTMRTPGQDEELAAGFLFTEGVIRSGTDILAMSRPSTARNRDNIVQIKLSAKLNRLTGSARRFGTISTSCGICGKDSIAAVRQNFPAVTSGPEVRIALGTLLQLPQVLRKHQNDFDRTGGIHAAGVFDINGHSLCIREDIGRHNAVDKVIGRALLDQILPLSRHVLLVSGRASFEIVQKALAAAIPIVASVSAPSNLAVSFCRANNQTLIGFLRPPALNLYSHVERVILEGAESKRGH